MTQVLVVSAYNPQSGSSGATDPLIALQDLLIPPDYFHGWATRPSTSKLQAANRGPLSQCLASQPNITGVLFLAHGHPHQITGEDGTAMVDAHNVAALKEKWVHAVCCSTAAEGGLAKQAIQAGVSRYAGYEREVWISFPGLVGHHPHFWPAFVKYLGLVGELLAQGADEKNN